MPAACSAPGAAGGLLKIGLFGQRHELVAGSADGAWGRHHRPYNAVHVITNTSSAGIGEVVKDIAEL